ncbi:MAG: hypothetical protein SVZ03_07555 [Spirochaetota bacterium]|nr:hypothetical protein [Spirochaetota bacterium]
MSNVEDYKQKIEEIQAIGDDEIRSPSNIPVDIFLQEAENLYHWCQEDKEELTANGLDWELVLDVPARCGALREAQSKWITSRFSQEEAQKRWAEDSPQAYDMRNEFLHSFRFAYRRLPDLLGRVNAIAHGYGHADMIQDLNDLSVLGKDNPEPLERINFDMTLLDKAADMADRMSDLLGVTTVERADSSESIKIRNKAYTHLRYAIDEIRAFGLYVFWRDEARYKGYTSEYNRKRRSKRDKEEDTLGFSA